MRIIAIPDIHTRADILPELAEPLQQADLVLLAGDMTNGGNRGLAAMQNVLDTVHQFNSQVYSVPGNMDNDDILQMTEGLGINIHRRHIIHEGVAICGLGGALPFAGPFVFTEGELAAYLEESIATIPEETPLILVSHQPPYGTICDQLSGGQHVGSHAVRAFIEAYQPLVCFSGHIHEAVGTDTIGQTVVINPGAYVQSQSYAYAEIVDGALITAEVRSKRASQP
ncbi:metallophosphoesterase family protein [Phototrophicus methaneseepsis]|uniref:Metallophosphoesterase family protein n=1 Tax=Phototrophicus methaneseepsis TaxID=2710758 RepID=A0A7S8ED55_9CHLR|nr:metallophosphoesterase [Phototrophicus methaneseepsis]QPC84775.1 metallophosphoesterase family protein [Phototrophicus methaneseepsis]